MFKPIEIKALPHYKLWLRYADGIQGEVDLSNLVGKGVFAAWKDPSAFKKVRIGDAGEIVWDNEIDLCPDSLYMRISGKTPEQLFHSCRRS